jgi:hypothetical protein
MNLSLRLSPLGNPKMVVASAQETRPRPASRVSLSGSELITAANEVTL